MKILHVTNAVGWSGGMEQMSLLIRELDKRTEQNILVCPPGSELLQKLSDSPVEKRTLPMYQDYDLIAAWKLRKWIGELGPDVVHAHHPMAHAIALVALSFSQEPAFVVSRRVSFSPRKNPFSRWKYRSPRIAKYAVVSQAVKETLIQGGVEASKIEVVYSSVNPQKFAPHAGNGALKQELGIPSGHTVVGKVANAARWKGQHIFLQAAKLCIQKNPKTIFVLAGKNTKELEPLARELGILENVRLLGFRKDVPDVISLFNVSVNSAIEGEGLSGAVRESLMMEVPVVASDVAGNREIVKDGQTGYLVPVNDASALASGILRALEEQGRARELAKNGRRWVLENATLERMTENFLHLYRSVIR